MRHLPIIALLILGLGGCQKPTPPDPPSSQPASPTQVDAKQVEGTHMDFVLKSTTFDSGSPIPVGYTGDGADISPRLSWENVPVGAAELALIVEDPDAPNGDFVHWVVYSIPPGMNSLDEGLPAAHKAERATVMQGRNDFGQLGYKGPAPPAGKPHHYHFRLMALDRKLGLGPNADKAALRRAVQGHVMAEAELVGTYER